MILWLCVCVCCLIVFVRSVWYQRICLSAVGRRMINRSNWIGVWLVRYRLYDIGLDRETLDRLNCNWCFCFWLFHHHLFQRCRVRLLVLLCGFTPSILNTVLQEPLVASLPFIEPFLDRQHVSSSLAKHTTANAVMVILVKSRGGTFKDMRSGFCAVQDSNYIDSIVEMKTTVGFGIFFRRVKGP